MRTVILIALLLTLGLTSADARRWHRHAYGSARGESAAEMVPPDWTLQPPDPNWKGQRFLSPDGAAWFALYVAPADQEPVSAHLKAVAFVDDEQITYLRGERDWLAVSGFKGDRIFYRKVILACGGRSWHHIALEYPAGMKRSMDRLVERASRALDRSEDEGCEQASAWR